MKDGHFLPLLPLVRVPFVKLGGKEGAASVPGLQDVHSRSCCTPTILDSRAQAQTEPVCPLDSSSSDKLTLDKGLEKLGLGSH